MSKRDDLRQLLQEIVRQYQEALRAAPRLFADDLVGAPEVLFGLGLRPSQTPYVLQALLVAGYEQGDVEGWQDGSLARFEQALGLRSAQVRRALRALRARGFLETRPDNGVRLCLDPLLDALRSALMERGGAA